MKIESLVPSSYEKVQKLKNSFRCDPLIPKRKPSSMIMFSTHISYFYAEETPRLRRSNTVVGVGGVGINNGAADGVHIAAIEVTGVNGILSSP